MKKDEVCVCVRVCVSACVCTSVRACVFETKKREVRKAGGLTERGLILKG